MWQKLTFWWADSKGKVLVALAMLLFVTLFRFPSFSTLGQILLTIAVVPLCDWLLGMVTERKGIVTLSSWVTGCIIAAIVDPSQGIFGLLAGVIASFGKRFMRRGPHQHVFNPAAFGIMSVALLLREPVGWWAASWGYLPAVVIAAGTLLALRQLRKIRMSLFFLLLYFLVMLISTKMLFSALRLTIDGSVVFFALVMLPEPMTSVWGGRNGYAWTLLVGLVLAAQVLGRIAFGDPLLVSLLIANLAGFSLFRTGLVRL